MIYVIGCLSIVGGPPPVRFLIRANRQPVSNFQSPADFLVFFFFFFFFIIIIIFFFFFFFFFFFLVFFFSFYGSPTRRNPFLFFLFTSPFFLMSFDSSVALIFFDLFLFLLVGKMESKIDCSVTGFWILGFFLSNYSTDSFSSRFFVNDRSAERAHRLFPFFFNIQNKYLKKKTVKLFFFVSLQRKEATFDFCHFDSILFPFR